MIKDYSCTRLTHLPDEGSSKNFWNVGKVLPYYTVQQLKINTRHCKNMKTNLLTFTSVKCIFKKRAISSVINRTLNVLTYIHGRRNDKNYVTANISTYFNSALQEKTRMGENMEEKREIWVLLVMNGFLANAEWREW